MQKNTNDIVIFLYGISILFLFLFSIILFLLLAYKKRQQKHFESITLIKQTFEKTILNTQLEIQEQTFQHISREIHDNISLSLTLAKLQLNTFDWDDRDKAANKLESSIQLLGKSIAELSDISKSLNADIIIQQGLLKALEEETERIQHADQFVLHYEVKGSPVFMDSNKELIIFRIIQEAFNNVIKHARATVVQLQLDFCPEQLQILIADNGKGFSPGHHARATVVQLQLDFCPEQLQILIADNGKGFSPGHHQNRGNAGLKNMETRANILKGEMQVFSSPETGTNLIFTIPIE
jgi:two-component system NarL family sensor kinase